MATLDFFLLCENTVNDTAGRITLVNIYDIVYAAELPVTQATFSLAFRIKPDLTKLKSSENKFRIEIISPSGKKLIDVEGAPQSDLDPKTLKEYIASQLQLNGIVFPEWGEYVAKLYLDNKLLGKRPFTVSEFEKE